MGQRVTGGDAMAEPGAGGLGTGAVPSDDGRSGRGAGGGLQDSTAMNVGHESDNDPHPLGVTARAEWSPVVRPLVADGAQTLRRTAVTLPRIVAWVPSIGSYASLCGSSQTWPPFFWNVFTVASPSIIAATMSPLSAMGC